MTDFSNLNLAEPILRALKQEGYATPTPIQAKAIPILLTGRDLLGVAQTGTGKTAAFALPLLDRLARNPAQPPRRGARILVLAPTRELASQIADSFTVYGRNLRIDCEAIFGGSPINKQVRRLERGVHVLAATPGRLIDLVERGALTLNGVEALVLDEADQMLDMGFIPSLRKIMAMLPKQRQTLLFSATMPKAIAELARAYLKDPARVEAAPVATTAERVVQRAIFVEPALKHALLAHALRAPGVDRVLVFARTKHGADRVVRNLDAAGIESSAIHGNKSQPQRVRALEAFRSGARPVLVATDIAARGLDIDGVSHVINFELPDVPEQYVHRIGRTARAGKEGIAISFVAPDERGQLRDIERLTRIKLEILPLPEGLAASRAKEAPRPERREHAPRDRKPRDRQHTENRRSEQRPADQRTRGGAPNAQREERPMRDRDGQRPPAGAQKNRRRRKPQRAENRAGA